MIEAIGRQPAGMLELQNNRQRLWVNSDFATVFRGATNESPTPSEAPNSNTTVTSLQKAVESASALSAGTSSAPLVSTTSPAAAAASTTTDSVTTSAATPGGASPYPAGWSGPPGLPGSSYNPIAAWDQIPGQQPAWVTGTYPGAEWTAVSEQGFLMPYSNLSPGPGEDAYSNANANVINQDWAKYYGQVDGTQAGNAMVWGANNPTDAIPAPWMASTNPDPQYTAASPSNTSQPTQPHYVPPNPAS